MSATAQSDGIFKVRRNQQGRLTIALPDDVPASYYSRFFDKKTGKITLIPVAIRAPRKG